MWHLTDKDNSSIEFTGKSCQKHSDDDSKTHSVTKVQVSELRLRHYCAILRFNLQNYDFGNSNSLLSNSLEKKINRIIPVQ